MKTCPHGCGFIGRDQARGTTSASLPNAPRVRHSVNLRDVHFRMQCYKYGKPEAEQAPNEHENNSTD